MIEQGTFEAVAIHHEFGTANEKEQVVVTFSLLEGPDKGKTIAWFGYFTEKAYERTMEALRYCGWKGDDLMNMGDLEQKVSIVIEHETYEGDTNARVKWVNKIGGGMVKLKDPMSTDKLRMFAASMKAKAAQIEEVAGEKVESNSAHSAPTNGNQPPPPSDDDIPWDGSEMDFG